MGKNTPFHAWVSWYSSLSTSVVFVFLNKSILENIFTKMLLKIFYELKMSIPVRGSLGCFYTNIHSLEF